MTADEPSDALRRKRTELERARAQMERATREADVVREHLAAVDHALADATAQVRALAAEVEMLEAGEGEARAATMRDHVREQVRLARLSHGMRQEDVADAMNKLGFTWRRLTVTEVESGKRHVSLDELVGLAQVFGRPVALFLAPETADGVLLERGNGEVIANYGADTIRALFGSLPSGATVGSGLSAAERLGPSYQGPVAGHPDATPEARIALLETRLAIARDRGTEDAGKIEQELAELREAAARRD